MFILWVLSLEVRKATGWKPSSMGVSYKEWSIGRLASFSEFEARLKDIRHAKNISRLVFLREIMFYFIFELFSLSIFEI